MLGHGTAKIADRTNTGAGTTYFPLINGADGYLEVEGNPVMTVQLDISNTTITIEASNDGSTWFDVSPVWEDLTSGATGVASWTADELLTATLNVRYVRFKSVRPGAANQEYIWLRRM